jgi:hypothetical protein
MKIKASIAFITNCVLGCSFVGAFGVGFVSAQATSTTTSLKTVQTTALKTEVPTKPSPRKTFDLTFDDLKFEMEKGGRFERPMLTPKINSYHNGTVRLRGYIRPSFSQSGLTKFIFVRDNKECCFGPGAAIYDCVLVRLEKGLTTDYTVRPVTIQGTFSLKEYKGPDGNVWSIYRMNDAKLK